MTIQQAYQKGKADAAQGHSTHDCPFSRTHQYFLRYAWLDGHWFYSNYGATQ